MSLRIASPGGQAEGRRDGADSGADQYFDRLVKLIPAEAVAAYPFLHSRAVDVAIGAGRPLDEVAAVSATTGAVTALETPEMMYWSASWLPAAVAWLILMLVIVLRWQATRGPDGRAQWGAVLIAAISFILWVPVLDDTARLAAANISGSFGIFPTLEHWGARLHPEVQRFIPELLLALWTILVPAFYRPSGKS